MRRVHEEHKSSIKAEEQKCLQEVPAQDEMCDEKEEISVDTERSGGETQPLDFKVVDPAWMKKGVVGKLRKSEIEFQKRCFERHCQTEMTTRGDKASSRAYWDRGRGVAET
ncbi:hypothetical protein TNCV_705641 [Trichonephila clavipes]|nr:hypothetical protein TNCV_705641 [Trichonephila clavipes]